MNAIATLATDNFEPCAQSLGLFGSGNRALGVVIADYNNDGRLDLCVVHHDCPAVLLRNECSEGTWLQVQLVGTQTTHNAVGTRVYATAGGTTQMQELMGGTSYCSAMQYHLNFGFSEPTVSCSLRVEWTGGEKSLLDNVPLNQAIVLLEPHQNTQPTIWTLPHAGKR